jgi:hypothetical protein
VSDVVVASSRGADVYLGSLCRRNHDYQSTGKSLRYKTRHCVECFLAQKRRYLDEKPGLRARMIERRRQSRVERACEQKAYDREYKQVNKILLREKALAYYRKNRNAICARRAEQHAKNPEPERKRQAAVKRKQRIEKREHLSALSHAYYRKNSVRIRLRRRISGAIRAYAKSGKVKKAAEYGIDVAAIANRIGPPPGPGKEWHIDHIRPLSSFDFNDESQIQAAFAPANHQWLPARDNLIKNDKYAHG